MMFVPDLPQFMHLPPSPGRYVTKLSPPVTYIRQPDFNFTLAGDDVPTAMYFTSGLDGRDVDSLKQDLLWPNGWNYA